jgi:hypothetical protein
VQSIETDRPLESDRGWGFIGIGRATLVLDNSGSKFYDNQGTNFEEKARIRIMLGYEKYRIPVFAGVVQSAWPGPRGDRVYVSCADYMILFLDQQMSGSRGANNTPELVAEDFCNEVRVQAGIGDGLELDTVYDDTNFEIKPMLWGLREVQNSVFHVSLFDEEGVLRMYEREYVGFSSDKWAYDERNALEADPMAPGEVINDVSVEYDENTYVRSIDQGSIDDNGRQARTTRILLCNSDDVSKLLRGRTESAMVYDEEGFQITTSATASTIDTIHLRLRQDGDAVGPFRVKIYSESTSLPDTLLGTSEDERGEFLATEYTWVSVYFDTPVSVDVSTNYWPVLDTSDVSAGTVYMQCSRADATGMYAYDDSGWTAVDNLQPLHRILASKMAQTVADDIVRFYGDKKDRLSITSMVGVPQVQLLDDIQVDIKAENTHITGNYTVERIQHSYTPRSFTTRHVMRKRSIEGPGAGQRDASQNFKLNSGKTLGDALLLGELILMPDGWVRVL